MLKNLTTFKGEHGNLFAINKVAEFQPKRIFYVTGVPRGQVRGGHAHLRDKQILVCIKGSLSVKLDDGIGSRTFLLNEGQSIFMDTMTWGTQEYLTGDDILLVLCSEEHDEEEYIKSYTKFLELTKENKK